MVSRRDFMKMAGLASLASLFPFFNLGDNMKLSDILLKIANNKKLTKEEKDFLVFQANETQQRNSQVAGFTLKQGGLNVNIDVVKFFETELTTLHQSYADQIGHAGTMPLNGKPAGAPSADEVASIVDNLVR